MLELSSSLRSISLEESLLRAKSISKKLGISRVTDITRLDSIDIPVFASIRPGAKVGSLCVNAGKGVKPNEALVGAYMEAIEFAFAEYGTSSLEPVIVTPKEILDGRTNPEAILKFCPVMNAKIDLSSPILAVEAENISTSEKVLIPAELVFLPYPHEKGGKLYFGSSSNGLCSGNSILEATVHGLSEVIERDIRSFQSVNSVNSRIVLDDSFSDTTKQLISKISRAGLDICIHYFENEYSLPYFMTIIYENHNPDPIYTNVGYGCHPYKRIALNRSICEAAQSRLSFIHGGRDDLIDRYNRFSQYSTDEKEDYAIRLIEKLVKRSNSIYFSEILDFAETIYSLEDALNVLMKMLQKQTLNDVLRVSYTDNDFPVQVTRIVVPGLEFFNESTKRVGVRLRDYVKQSL